MSENKRKHKDPNHRAFVRRMIVLVVAAFLFLIVALLETFVPFQTWLPAYALPAREEGTMRIHFLSVGQGDCTIIEFPGGDCLVVDAGDGSFRNDNKIYRYLKGLTFSRLSVVATHADVDHCGGVGNILLRYRADRLYLPALDSKSKFYMDMLKRARRRGTATEALSRYDVITDSSGAYMTCISPYSIEETNGNDASALLYLRYGETVVLLGADVSSTRERRLMREYAADDTIFDSGEYIVRLEETDILKVSHHGSDASSSEEWLELLGATTAIISCGADNAYKHPGGEAITRLAKYVRDLYRTDELGDIIVTLTQTSYTVTYAA